MYAVYHESGYLWDTVYKDVAAAKYDITQALGDDDDGSDFMIYKLVLATEPRTKVEWS